MTIVDADRRQLEQLLQVHYCDTPNQQEHGKQLRAQSKKYLSNMNFGEKAQLFKAISDEKRLSILKMLTIREMCVCELTAALGLTQPNLTHHIKKLEGVGLVAHDKRGKWVYYRIVDHKIFEKITQFNY